MGEGVKQDHEAALELLRRACAMDVEAERVKHACDQAKSGVVGTYAHPTGNTLKK